MGYKTSSFEVGDPPRDLSPFDARSSSSDVRTVRASESLNPLDWEEFRRLAHAVVERAIDHLKHPEERPAWQPVSDATERLLHSELPMEGIALAEVVDDFFDHILPYPTGNAHPRFWGWVGGGGTPGGVIAETLTAMMNSVPGNFNDAPARVEDQVVEWMRQVLNMPEGTSGILTSGGSVANLIGIAVGRDARGGYDTVREGVNTRSGRLVLYASEQVHSSVYKAAQLLGLGRDAIRVVRVHDDFTMDLDHLLERIESDRADGFRPFAIVGSAGTVNTGAIDDLKSLAGIAKKEGLWLHIDGAFGALAALSPALREKIDGIEQADSVAFDFHKWMSVQYDAGCVLIRDPRAHRKTFTVEADYLTALPRGTASRAITADDMGPQLSRGFRALKVWMTIREHGIAKFGRIVEQNVADAQYLAHRLRESDDFEVLAPVPLNVVVFQYNPGGLDGKALNDLNRELLMQIQESGIAVPSSTMVNGRFALRVANVNHRTVREDFDLLISALRRFGRREVKGAP